MTIQAVLSPWTASLEFIPRSAGILPLRQLGSPQTQRLQNTAKIQLKYKIALSTDAVFIYA